MAGIAAGGVAETVGVARAATARVAVALRVAAAEELTREGAGVRALTHVGGVVVLAQTHSREDPLLPRAQSACEAAVNCYQMQFFGSPAGSYGSPAMKESSLEYEEGGGQERR